MNIRLLFADNSISIQKMVKLAFVDYDINVITAICGKEVLEKLKEITPDIIIADIDMPDINGIELCRQIRQNPDFDSIPVVILQSDSSEKISKTEMNNVGINGSLTKPFKSEELVEKVRIMISNKDNHTEDTLIAGEEDSKNKKLLEFENEYIQDNNSTDELLFLKPQDEIDSSLSYQMEPDPLLEVISVDKKDIRDEDLNLSGLLSPEDIKEEKKEINIRNKDIEELFEIDNEIEWIEDDEKEDEESHKRADSEGSKDSITNPAIAAKVNIAEILTKLKIEQALKEVIGSMVVESNEKILKEKLEELLQTITPQIVNSVEKVVWEIVPDLAETIIKKELEKIKHGY